MRLCEVWPPILVFGNLVDLSGCWQKQTHACIHQYPRMRYGVRYEAKLKRSKYLTYTTEHMQNRQTILFEQVPLKRVS